MTRYLLGEIKLPVVYKNGVGIVDARWPSSFPRQIVRGTHIYYVASLISALSIALPHAVLTPILLAKGATLSEIAFIQIFYSLAVFIFEVPSGVVADTLGRKHVYILSKIFLAVFAALVFWSSSVFVLCLAWFIYGLANALESGTIGNEVILAVRKFCRVTNLESGFVIHYLVRLDARFETIGMIMGGFIGAALYPFIADGLYLGVFAFALFVGLFVLGAFHLNAVGFDQPNAAVSQESERVIDLFTIAVRDALSCLKDTAIRQVMLVIAITQVFFQVHFQFWQAYFLEKGVDAKYFGIVYVIFQLVSVFVTFLGSSNIARLRDNLRAKAILALVGIALLVVMFFSSQIALFAYLLFVCGFWIVVFYADAHFRSLASENSLSTLTSVSSAVARGASILTLGLASILLHYFTITILVPIFFLTAGILLLILYLYSKKNRQTHP